MLELPRFDVFLSHNSADKSYVRELAARLTDEANIDAFLDQWDLVPGEPWQEAIEEAIEQSKTCAVFLGPSGAGPWEREEMRAALEQRVASPAFRVIPVLLPGATEPPDPRSLPPFLRRLTWVDMSASKGFAHLVAGIKGFAPRDYTEELVQPDWLDLLELGDLLENPTGIAAFANGFFVADHTKGHILRVEDANVTARLDNLNRPHHLAIVGDTVIATDTHNHRILEMDWNLRVLRQSTRVGRIALRRPHGVTSRSPSEYYLLSSDNNTLLVRVAGGKLLSYLRNDTKSPPEGDGQFSIPCGLACSAEHVFVADTYNHRIQVFDHRLNFVGKFGSYGAGRHDFAYPVGLAIWHQWLLIADEHNHRLQLWRTNLGIKARSGQIASPVAGGLCSPWLKSPFGISVSSGATCYVADRFGGQVLKFNLNRLLSRYE